VSTPKDFGPYGSGLDQRPANYTPLSPLSFLKRSARVYPNYTSIVHGDRRYTWAQTHERCRRLGSALSAQGIGRGDTVSVLAPNVPEIYEAHFGVSMAGGVLNTINTRLDAAAVAFILDHAESKVLITDTELSPIAKRALDRCRNKPKVVDVHDPGVGGEALGDIDYESFIAGGDPAFDWRPPDDEWQAISLNYTSGTTGNPKGVVYHHRGAYLNAMSNIVGWDMPHHPVYLWTLPMFHCNGWCFPWTLAAVAGTSVCLRGVTGASIYKAIAEYGVTHFCGAPIVLSMVINAGDDERRDFDHPVKIMTAAAPPPASVLANIEKQGFQVTHVYGLTETYGPAVICSWKKEWDAFDVERRAAQKSRQGVPYHVLEDLEVMDPETMRPVPRDGETMGEVMFQGNIVMKGYLKNPDTTEKSLHGDWFHSGDLGVMHPDGYIQLKDRAKDIIISGGENISSIEVEDCLYGHPAVDTAAVVARPDDEWGETPCAFITLRPGAAATEQEIIDFCRDNLAHFKCPKTVLFGEIPKTSTGKIQKFKLRERANELGSLNR
jgi:fatty-acyl-CoA synthase